MWICNKVTILKGVNIEDNVVIGTGSIVTTNFEKNSLIAGIPAIILKKNINWKRERISEYNEN